MNSILLKNVRIFSGAGVPPFQADLRIGTEGRIELPAGPAQQGEWVFDASGMGVSTGWTDMRAVLCEPGFEHKDDLRSLQRSAAAGGFTAVAVLPNTKPAIQTKESVRFVRTASEGPVALLPIAALSKDCAGQEMAELYDLHHAGAIAFSDGLQTARNAGLVKNALLYLKSFNGLLIDTPDEESISLYGQMHEGAASTRLGMKGIPALAEEMAIRRQLALAEYTGAAIHFSVISAAGSVELIRQAKARGIAVTCDTSAHHLFFTDEDLFSFDTFLKSKPPFRTEQDRQALWQGIREGVIDAVVSAHQPQDQESKELEFDLADFGLLGLETTFAALRTAAPADIETKYLLGLLTTGPARILSKSLPALQDGAPANLTLFHPEMEWTPTAADFHSFSGNTPYVGRPLKGRPLAVWNQGASYLSPALENFKI